MCANAVAPSSSIPLPIRSRTFKDVFARSARANAFAPSTPIKLPLRSRVVSVFSLIFFKISLRGDVIYYYFFLRKIINLNTFYMDGTTLGAFSTRRLFNPSCDTALDFFGETIRLRFNSFLFFRFKFRFRFISATTQMMKIFQFGEGYCSFLTYMIFVKIKKS